MESKYIRYINRGMKAFALHVAGVMRDNPNITDAELLDSLALKPNKSSQKVQDFIDNQLDDDFCSHVINSKGSLRQCSKGANLTRVGEHNGSIMHYCSRHLKCNQAKKYKAVVEEPVGEEEASVEEDDIIECPDTIDISEYE